ncbi:Hypothetical predicted protein [Pelobates cultripes]|uniref:Uncharacterized protein n=1 Tax=Pelobates cultripes TaxID=61616 RepID=A0AAD1S418_PELCU|nr:Hypothetical predicted protein [Pelobates cultripes]
MHNFMDKWQVLFKTFYKDLNITVIQAVLLVLLVAVILKSIFQRREKSEYNHLLHDVAYLTLEKEQLEDDTNQLIEENYNLTQDIARIRKRNNNDINEENNQLFHDVTFLSLENKEIVFLFKRLEEENVNLEQSLQILRYMVFTL